jgi:hypothetical protein
MRSKNFLLSSAATFAPANEGGAGGEDEIIPPPELDGDDADADPPETDADDPDDAEAEADDEADEPDDPDGNPDEPPARQPRGERQFGELRKTARETARQNAELTRQLAEMRGELTAMRQQPIQPAETAQQRADRLALLTPEERAEIIVNEALARSEANTRALQQQFMDQGDKASFDAQAVANPLLKKLSPQIEREIAGMRQNGRPVPPRNVIAAYLIGQKVLEQQGQRNPGRQQRRAAQRTRPLNPGSNAGAQRQRRGDAPVTAEDFEGQFGDVSI